MSPSDTRKQCRECHAIIYTTAEDPICGPCKRRLEGKETAGQQTLGRKENRNKIIIGSAAALIGLCYAVTLISPPVEHDSNYYRGEAWHICHTPVENALPDDAQDVTFPDRRLETVREVADFHYEVRDHVTWTDWRGDRLRTYYVCELRRNQETGEWNFLDFEDQTTR